MGLARVCSEALVQILAQGKKATKKDEKGRMAMDNAIAALVMLRLHQPQHCHGGIAGCMQLCLQRLPLKNDEEESKKVNRALVERVQAQDANVMGPDNQNAARLLGVFAEVYKTDISDKENDHKIKSLLKAVPQVMLESLQAQFSEKQRRK